MQSSRNSKDADDSTASKKNEGFASVKIIENYDPPQTARKPRLSQESYSSTPQILKNIGYPPENRSKSIFDFSKHEKNRNRSFHEVDIVSKKTWRLYVLNTIDPDFSRYEADSYLLMREKNAPWHLYYKDEEEKVKTINLKQVDNLAEILKNTPEQLSETDQAAIRSAITIYRTKVQNKKTPNPAKRYFFKHSSAVNSPMTWLEAICCSFYQLLSPHHVTSTKAIFDDSEIGPNEDDEKYIAACSTGIPGFKSAREDPLKEEDLAIEVLDKKYLTIEELDAIDKNEKQQLDKLNPTHVLTKISRRTIDNKNEDILVTVKDLRNYRIVKGLATSLTASRINNEDDCHTGNLSKFGMRIDFDMTWWNIVFKFKSSSLVDWAFRNPSEDRYIITENDIRHFPNLKDSKPFYWPTNPAPYIPETMTKVLANFFPISQNAFTAQENSVYQKLEKHPVFIYHKFMTLLKYLLTDAEMYRNIFKLHGKENKKLNGKLIIDMFAEEHTKQINTFREVLINMPEFYDFLQEHGAAAFKNIEDDFIERNNKFDKKIKHVSEQILEALERPKKHSEDEVKRLLAWKRIYLEQKIYLPEIKSKYKTISRETKEKNDKKTVLTFEADDKELFTITSPKR